MTVRAVVVVLAVPFLLVSTASAADVVPKPGILLDGAIKFPRRQQMSVQTDPADGTRLTVRMGFDGKCEGGGIQEAWASSVEAKPTVRVRDGRFNAILKATERDLGGIKGRTGKFTWRFTGRFTAEDQITATVSGRAEVRTGGKLARCTIAKPASVRLAVRR
jgi:hypothetical protein